MKKLVFLFAFIFCVGTALAVGPTSGNPSVPSNNVTLSTTAITPFDIWDVNGSAVNGTLPDVIKGQLRDIPDQSIELFEMKKETMYYVYLTFNVPQPQLGVNLIAHWRFTDTPPMTPYDFPGVAVNSSFNWYGPQIQGWCYLVVEQIDATGATGTGLATFTCSANGYYTGL
jgi:hypothetical protein